MSIIARPHDKPCLAWHRESLLSGLEHADHEMPKLPVSCGKLRACETTKVRRRIGMPSEARVGVLSKAQSRDQPISQSFSQSALDRSDLPCQVMAEKAPEEARNHLCGLQISRVACEAKQDAEGARLRRGSRRLSSLCYDCASCEYVEVICLPSCKSLKDCPCTGEPISICSMLGCSRLN